MVRRITTVALATLCVAASAPAGALGDTGDIIAPQHAPPTAADGWQAGVCNSDLPECSPESPDAQYSTQAAAHPPFGFTQFITKDGDKRDGPRSRVLKLFAELIRLRVQINSQTHGSESLC